MQRTQLSLLQTRISNPGTVISMIATNTTLNTMNSTLYPCPCCGFLTKDGPPGTDEFCPICAWQDDLYQLRYATRSGGPNRITLVQEQINYSEHGTSKIGRQPSAPSSAGFDRDENWRPIDLKIDNIELSFIGDTGNTYPKDLTQLYYWRPTYWRRQP